MVNNTIEPFCENSVTLVSSMENSTKRKLRKRKESINNTKNNRMKKKRDYTDTFKSEKDAKKFYLNINKNVKVKPALLETIFEEEEDIKNENSNVRTKFGKAIKRSLTIKDGFNLSKTLTNKRKNVIKKKLGHRKKRTKKTSLKKFIEDFKLTQAHDGYQVEH